MKVTAALVGMMLLAAPAAAQSGAAPADAQPKAESGTKRTLTFLAGFAAGFGLHEAGHIVTSAAFGAHPRVRGVEPRPVPFFAIVHDPVTRRQEFVISSSGFWMQHATSEWILSARPNIAREHAPFQKGVLAFNVGTSVVYGVAAFARSGPAERDTRGMAISLGKDGVPEPVVGLLTIAPAVLDGYRYLRPDATWAKWTSRAIKIAGVALVAAAY